MERLKPCPFCGGKARMVESVLPGFYVACSNVFKCGGRQEQFDTEAEAIEAWNRRNEDGKVH